MSELSELLWQYMPKDWSRRQLGREARDRGFDLSDASATAYLRGSHGTPDDSTIEAFVKTLGIPERLVRAAAKVRHPGKPWDPPGDSRYLRDDQRTALEHLISTMVEREAGTGPWSPSSSEDDSPATEPVINPFDATGARGATRAGSGQASENVSPTEP